MISKRIKDKGILVKLLEKSIKILVTKECKKIGKIKIDIIATSIQIITGIIQKIYVIAEDINYKDLLFDSIELEANNVKIQLKISNKELKLKKNLITKFKISLSENSLKTVLMSSNWNWIADIISNEILNQDKLEDLKIKNDHILIKTSKDKKTINEGEKVYIKLEKGRLYLDNKAYNKSIRIPIEEKVCIKDINIENNLINISANSSIDF